MQNANCKLKIGKRASIRSNLQFAIPWSLVQLVTVCAIVLGCGRATFANEPAAQPPAESNVKIAPGAETHGISLGDYRIRSYYPVDAQKGTVRFTLYAGVKDEHFAAVQKL